MASGMAQHSDDRRWAERTLERLADVVGQAFLNGLQSVFNSRMSPPSPVEPSVASMLMVATGGSNVSAYRDVKPANILVCRVGADDDFVKVLDFGLVKRTAAGRPSRCCPRKGF